MENQKNYYTVTEVIEVVFNGNLSRTTINKLMNTGEIPCVKFLSKRLIPASWVKSMISKAQSGEQETETW